MFSLEDAIIHEAMLLQARTGKKVKAIVTTKYAEAMKEEAKIKTIDPLKCIAGIPLYIDDSLEVDFKVEVDE
jgi:hypothetical protein